MNKSSQQKCIVIPKISHYLIVFVWLLFLAALGATDNTCPCGCSGDNCEIFPEPVSPCNSHPCHNFGICHRDCCRGYWCECQGTWTGPVCLENPCLPNPCENEGTCSLKEEIDPSAPRNQSISCAPYPDFYTSTEDDVAYADYGEGVNATIPCNLVFTNPLVNRSRVAKVHLIWYFNATHELKHNYSRYNSSKEYLYTWDDEYDGPLESGDERFSRSLGYHLTIVNFTEWDEGRYCCELFILRDMSRVNCTNVYYKYMNTQNFKTYCDGNNPRKYSNILVPANFKAEIKGFYLTGDINASLVVPVSWTERRAIHVTPQIIGPYIINARSIGNNATPSLGNIRYDAVITHRWIAAGTVSIMTLLTHPFFPPDGQDIICTYISSSIRLSPEVTGVTGIVLASLCFLKWL